MQTLQRAIAEALKRKSKYGQVTVQAELIHNAATKPDGKWSWLKDDNIKWKNFTETLTAVKMVPVDSPFVDKFLKKEIQELKKEYNDNDNIGALKKSLTEVPKVLQAAVEKLSSLCGCLNQMHELNNKVSQTS